MELSRIPDIGPVHAGILAEAGVATLADLAAVRDFDALSARTRVHPATLRAFQDAVHAHVESLLGSAGIRGPDDLAAADVAELAARTGLAVASLAHFQRAARERLGLPTPQDRVLLADGRATARVSVDGVVHPGVALVTLRFNEPDEGVFERVRGDAVILRERAATAPARIGGALHRDLPIYKETPERELRVRVAAIKDRTRDEKSVQVPVSAPAPMAAAEPPQPAKKRFGFLRRGT